LLAWIWPRTPWIALNFVSLHFVAALFLRARNINACKLQTLNSKRQAEEALAIAMAKSM
jgi:hypothetical protein